MGVDRLGDGTAMFVMMLVMFVMILATMAGASLVPLISSHQNNADVHVADRVWPADNFDPSARGSPNPLGVTMTIACLPNPFMAFPCPCDEPNLGACAAALPAPSPMLIASGPAREFKPDSPADGICTVGLHAQDGETLL